jgi:hypothetical protein
MWILLSIFPELSDEGEVVEIIGCFTDIRYVLFYVELHLISGSLDVLSLNFQPLICLHIFFWDLPDEKALPLLHYE